MSFSNDVHKAATLAVYKVSSASPVAAIQSDIDAIDKTKTLVDIDGLTYPLRNDLLPYATRSGIVRVVLPVEVYKDEPRAWLHLVKLKEILEERGYHCDWASSWEHDRSASVRYEIVASKCDPRLSSIAHRTLIMSGLAQRAKVGPPVNVWEILDPPEADLAVEGQVQMRSPREASQFCKKRVYTTRPDEMNVEYTITITPLSTNLVPVCCTEVVAYIKDYTLQEAGKWEPRSSEIMDTINAAVNTRYKARITNMRFRRNDLLSITFTHIQAAQAFCEYPLSTSPPIFARPLFALNQSTSNSRSIAMIKWNDSKYKQYLDTQTFRITSTPLSSASSQFTLVTPTPVFSRKRRSSNSHYDDEEDEVEVEEIRQSEQRSLEVERKMTERDLKCWGVRTGDVASKQIARCVARLTELNLKRDSLKIAAENSSSSATSESDASRKARDRKKRRGPLREIYKVESPKITPLSRLETARALILHKLKRWENFSADKPNKNRDSMRTQLAEIDSRIASARVEVLEESSKDEGSGNTP